MSYLAVVDFDASLVPPHPGPFAGGGVGQKAELVAVAAGGLRCACVEKRHWEER